MVVVLAACSSVGVKLPRLHPHLNQSARRGMHVPLALGLVFAEESLSRQPRFSQSVSQSVSLDDPRSKLRSFP